ncbi:OmpA family protein [Butyricimonas paravirosa]
MRKKKIQILLSVAVFLFLMDGAIPVKAQERKLGRVERRADRNFVRQKFNKAMAQYETALKKEENVQNQAALHLKIARLYFMVRDYSWAIGHYEKAMELERNLFLVDDVCDYIDALRFQGQARKAEAICLDNAYRDQYSRYQRYQNTLEALAMRHSVQEFPGFTAKRLSLNTPNAEFWIGNYGEQPFYAISYSKFNDPGKLFFHRTHYYELKEAGEKVMSQKSPRYSDYFRKIPVDLQNGPVTFSPDMQVMVTTVIEYDKKNVSVEMVDKKHRPFRTKLYYSVIKSQSKRFGRYIPVFPQDPENSYAHPYLFNDGKSLLFTSDMPGGFGGFDLYVVHWDEETQEWGTPMNLGADVNTEGNEIFPVLYEGRLVFSSNGLPGFGGYDLFNADYDHEGVVPGSVRHFPYPVNSVFNDYFMCPLDLRTAYFVSDREMESRDDIYYLQTEEDLGTLQGDPHFGMSEESAILGGTLLLNGATEAVVKETISLKQYAPEGLLMTLYFNFDSDKLTQESIQCLKRFIDEMGTYYFTELRFDGFADEMGSDNYNYALSARRAKSVAEFLRDHGVNIQFNIKAHGKVKLSPEEMKEEMGTQSEGNIDWIQVNRRARRVEIYHKR